MSQYGAQGMALAGSAVTVDILLHYYTGVQLEDWHRGGHSQHWIYQVTLGRCGESMIVRIQRLCKGGGREVIAPLVWGRAMAKKKYMICHCFMGGPAG